MINATRLLAKSSEGTIYLLESEYLVSKVYKSNIEYAKKVSEFKFLTDYQNTGHVPILHSDLTYLKTNGAIVMEYLEGYITLSLIKPYLTCNDIKIALCTELIKGRKSIGDCINYSDLHNKNVMVSISNWMGDAKVMVKFIDPGESSLYYGAWREWCLDIARGLGIVKIMKKCI